MGFNVEAFCSAVNERVAAGRNHSHKVRIFLVLMGERRRLNAELSAALMVQRRAAASEPSEEEVEAVFRAVTADF
jgi:hypothetical protein